MPLTATVSKPDLFTDLTRGAVACAPAHDWVPGITSMAHHQDRDLCEMPLGVAVQAIAVGQPILLLPVVLLRRTPHVSLLRRRTDPISGPTALRGRRIGVRSYTQTTGAWIRAVLDEQAGLAPGDLQWVTTDAEPFEELPAPPFVTRTVSRQPLAQALRDGELDAVVASDVPVDDEDLTCVFDPVAESARPWLSRGPTPIGHLLVARRETVHQRPGAVAELIGTLRGYAATQPGWAAGDEFIRSLPVADCFDVGTIRDSVAAFADRCIRQGILTKPLDLDSAIWDPAATAGNGR